MSSPSNHPPAKQRLGDFEISHEIGRGGMGVVYEARQVSLNRKVALKVLSGGLGLTAKAVQRFRREAEAAASLHHTNIVPVYATGEANGALFYAMELIDGPSLDQVVRQLRQTPTGAASQPTTSGNSTSDPANLAQTGPYLGGTAPSAATAALSTSSLDSGSGYFDTAARMMAEVADALEHAHQQGVLHRDIKPSNLLLSSAGRLSVNDFGLARMLEQPGMTMTGEFVGTPAYMSPEQITAGRTPLDHRTDIYSLGATLYELLTLHPPFTGERRDQVLAQIMHKEPKSPRQVNKKVPVDLETICLKAMEKDPDRRYQTAGQMAEDLRHYVNRFAISARRAGPVERLKKWVRRRPGVAAALAGLVALALVAGFFAYRAHVSEQHRLAEQGQSALDKALLLTLAADFEGAQRAVDEAERLKAPAGQLRIRQGEIALFRFEFDQAVRHLEQAVFWEPDSVAARAMLAFAYLNDGQWDKFEKTHDEVERLTPKTPEDNLHKGRLQVFRDRDEGLKTIDEALRMKASLLGYAFRASARTDLASDRADPTVADLAIEDARNIKSLLADSPLAHDTSAYAHMVAAGVYRAAGQDEKARAALSQGEKDTRALEGWVAWGAKMKANPTLVSGSQPFSRNANKPPIHAGRHRARPRYSTLFRCAIYASSTHTICGNRGRLDDRGSND